VLDIAELVRTQNDGLDLTIPCPCECGGRLARFMEWVDEEFQYVVFPFTAEDLERYVRPLRLTPHPKIHFDYRSESTEHLSAVL